MVDRFQRPATPPDHLRCVRADGRSWRCKNQRLDGGRGFCDAHYRQRMMNSRARVSVKQEEGGRRRGRPRKEASVVKGVGAKEEREDLGEKNLEVYVRKRRREKKPLEQCSVRTSGNPVIEKDLLPRSRIHSVVEQENKAFLALGDGASGNKKIMKGGEDLKIKNANSVAMVVEGLPKDRRSVERTKENPTARKGHQDLLSHQILHEGNIDEGRSNFTPFPSPSPLSPNIGDSTHQHSLLTQKQPDSCIGPPAPSASTSRKICQDKIADIMLDNQDTGSGMKSSQRVKLGSRVADEFSVSKCADVLNEMTGFTPEELVEASKVFVKQFNREMFLSLKDELRRVWLRAQLSG